MTTTKVSTKRAVTSRSAASAPLPSEVEKAIRAKMKEAGDAAHPLASEAYASTYELFLKNADELKTARRCVEIYAAEADQNAAHLFLEHGVDPVMSNSSENLMVDTPEHELFVFLFVRAAREYRD